jgi:hypothetical protein
MATYRTFAAAFLAIALALPLVLLAGPAQAAKGKPGPVCKWKDRKHPSCVVVLVPKWKKPDATITVTPAPLPKPVA